MDMSQYYEYRLYRDHGMGKDEFDTMLKEQDGRCAICHKELDKPHLDHDHKTGKVRGILCPTCNWGLGMFKDSIRNLASAIVYLEDHGHKF